MIPRGNNKWTDITPPKCFPGQPCLGVENSRTNTLRSITGMWQWQSGFGFIKVWHTLGQDSPLVLRSCERHPNRLASPRRVEGSNRPDGAVVFQMLTGRIAVLCLENVYKRAREAGSGMPRWRIGVVCSRSLECLSEEILFWWFAVQLRSTSRYRFVTRWEDWGKYGTWDRGRYYWDEPWCSESRKLMTMETRNSLSDYGALSSSRS